MIPGKTLQKQAQNYSMKTYTRSSVSSISILIILFVLILSGCRKTGPYSLTLTVIPDGAGTVTADTIAEKGYEPGTEVNLSEQPSLSYYFIGWSGDATGSDNPLTVIMNRNKEIEAGYAKGFFEDFEDDSANYFVNDGSSHWDVTDTVLVITGTNDEGKRPYNCYNYNQFGDFEFSVKLGIESSAYDAGIFFRAQTQNPFESSYQLCIVPNGHWLLIKWKDNTPGSIQDYISSDNLNTGIGSTNNIKVICSGTSIEVIFNNVSQGTFTDPDFSSGYAGVWASDFVSTASFDDLFLKEI